MMLPKHTRAKLQRWTRFSPRPNGSAGAEAEGSGGPATGKATGDNFPPGRVMSPANHGMIGGHLLEGFGELTHEA
jgi:hypothetical protein